MLPNIRKFFIPDPGFTLIEGDLKQSDAQVVAWESNDLELKDMFRRGVDVHNENSLAIWGPPITKARRQGAKVGVHAVDYGCKKRTLAAHLNITESAAEAFINTWFRRHPRILAWHHAVEARLRDSRTITNVWGYRRQYFDRLDTLLPEALAWIGQSTTAITINKAIDAVDTHLGDEVQPLLQDHDSYLMQVPTTRLAILMPKISSLMHITIPYSDPLIIPVEFKTSDRSWGEVEPYKEAA